MKKTVSILLALVLLLSAFTLTACAPPRATDTVYIAIKDYGLITAELYGNAAPITVDNFISLAEAGFYDNLTFHRVIENFMIQGGDPKGNGTGGSGKNITGEFANNGIDTGIAHVRGTLSMARSGSPLEQYASIPEEYRPYLEQAYNSASSQFFIVHKTSDNNTRSLDGKYAAFGQVVEGIEIVDQIAAVQTNADDKPLEAVIILTITLDREKAEAALAK